MDASERRTLAQEASRLGVDLSGDQLARLEAYTDVLRLWNRRIRLLGDRDPEALIRKHIPDCLALLSVLPTDGPVADIGSGAGLPGLVSTAWYAMVAPPEMKAELQNQIAAATIEVLKMPDVQQRFRALNIEPDGRTPGETAAFIKDEVQRWGRVIRENKIVLE